MAVTTALPGEAAAEWTRMRGRAPGLDGLEGQMRLIVNDSPVGLLNVAGEEVEIAPEGASSASLIADNEQTLLQLLGGELHPVVARLQERARVEGDTRFALRVLLGLQAGSPWTGLAPRS